MLRAIETFVKSMSPIEWAAVVTSLLCVYLTVRNNIWNWVWGFVGVVLYGYVFYRQGLYANAALQLLYYVPVQFVGWYVWKRTGPNKNDDLPVSVLSNRARVLCVAVCVALSAVFYFALKDWLPALFPKLTPDPSPALDGITTAVSIVAQYLQIPKKFENWLLWLGVDIVSVVMFLQQKLWPTAILYAVLILLAAKGAIDWSKLLREQERAKNEAAVSAEAVTEPVRPYV